MDLTVGLHVTVHLHMNKQNYTYESIGQSGHYFDIFAVKISFFTLLL